MPLSAPSTTDNQGRRHLLSLIAQAAEEARTETPPAVLYLDVDRFREINRAFGHEGGDRILRALAALLREILGASSQMVHCGGGVFALLVRRSSPAESAALAHEICSRTNDHLFRENGQSFHLAVSLGLYQLEGADADRDAFARAEAACSEAKLRGGNRVAVYRSGMESGSRLLAHSEWWTRVKEAMRDSRLELWYQPVVDIPTRAVVFHECLARFRDREGEIAPPAHFLPSVERSGGMMLFDRHIIGLATAALQASKDATLSVNVSTHSLGDVEFASFLISTFHKEGLSPARMLVEIPENIVLDMDRVAPIVDGLRKQGFRFALDDFGTGFCSFSYLKQLPVDILKIDGVFIRDLLEQSRDQALVHLMNETAHLLELRTVAEFVEDEETLGMLGKWGVDYAQGYLTGAPRPTFS